jgi:SAM-dependent methyltransferase
MSERYLFDRKTFDPINNRKHKRILTTLRQRGHGRAIRYAHKIHHTVPAYTSLAFRALNLKPANGGQVYLDLACGSSPDVLVAQDYGYEAWGLDLFPPYVSPLHDDIESRMLSRFIRADIADGLPFASESVDYITCYAAIDLIKTDERATVYKEIKRILKPEGELAFTGVPLTNGYGYDFSDEIERMRLSGLRRVRNGYGAQVLTPGEPAPVIRRPYTYFTARDFRRGERVQQSQHGIDHLKRQLPNAIVTGFSNDGRCIYVRLDTQKFPTSFYAGFWEPLSAIESAA